MRSYRVIIGRSPQEIEAAQRLRKRVYVHEEGLLDERRCHGDREVNRLDLLDTTLHFLVYAKDEAVGTVRALLPSAEVARGDGTKIGIDLETKLDLHDFYAPAIVLAEVTRFCVLREHRQGGVAAMLFAEMLAECRRRGVTHLLAGATLGTDSRADAELALAVVRHEGLMSDRFRAEPRRRAPAPGPSRLRIYSEEEQQRAQRGDLGGLELPPRLFLFMRWLKARGLGAPVFDDYFRIFAAPIAAALEDIPARAAR